MAINIDLKQYKESKEWKEIVTKCNNKVETLEREIDAVYNSDADYDDLKHKMTKNEFDVKDLWLDFLNWVLWELKSKKAEELVKFYEFRRTNSNLFLYQPINQYGQSNSILRYTDLDMKRFERSHFARIEDEIDGLIGNEQKEEDLGKSAF